jgi:hypothetical protein
LWTCWGSAPVASGALQAALAVLKPRRAFVVHGGEGTWPMPGGITAIPLAELAAQIRDGGD